MADKTTESSKKTRAEGRERRRSLAAEPFEQLDEAAREPDSGRSEAARTVKHALATGVAGAVAAGLGGATKAWLDRRSASGSEEPEREGTEEPSSEGAEQDVEASETGAAEEPSPEGTEAPPRGETEAIVSTARDQLERLLEREVESVSGFERSDGRWCVTLEVVEVRRIPESTDVLGSYEVVLDEGQNLVSFGQTRRYRRSQVEEG
jgi:gas vesicle protein GvpO